MRGKMFSVIDLETTGLYAKVDRIVEVAVINIDNYGNILSEYSTLVNPERDVSAYHIHGISAKDVINAPNFEEIAGKILELLKNTTLVAHNANFDVRFLDSEYRRLGYYLPDIAYICTMKLVNSVDYRVPSRKLIELCKYFDIQLTQAHSALDDARATAALFSRLVSRAKDKQAIIDSVCRRNEYCPTPIWPTLPCSERVYTRSHSQQKMEVDSDFITVLINRLPVNPMQQSDEQDYLMLLDRALEDRKISEQEALELYEIASECGLSKGEAESLHIEYLRELTDIAFRDSVITENERKDLDEVRRLLGISEEAFHQILKEQTSIANMNVRPIGSNHKNRDLQNKSVCFTGELEGMLNGEIISRSLAQHVAQEHGMIVRNGVTKDLDILVTRDPDSLSGKAVKARKYGTRIVSESVFWQMLGLDVE